ncbi:MAG TPA: hypothetical protein VJS88_06095 [Chthoniobacterales bacterium]|nr:hypothetical protein [Chthoniobacterales bacterium]
MSLRNTRRGWMLSADKGGASGAVSEKTDLEQLTEAREKITALEGEKKDAIARAEKAEGEVTTLKGDVTKLDGEKKDAIARAEKAEGEVKTLKGEAKSAEEKAREMSAASGVTPTPKTEAGQNGRTEDDGKQLFEQYNKLMTDGESRKASEFWEKNEKALIAYQESLTNKRD